MTLFELGVGRPDVSLADLFAGGQPSCADPGLSVAALAELMGIASAPVGAAFTAIALATGSLWGRPAWGTYWVWDARLTSTLILLFLYFGVIGLYRAIEDRRKAARAAGLLAIIGTINLPIIKYSVSWWNTLHQPASINLLKANTTIDPSMLWPLLVMAIATKLYYLWSSMSRAQLMVLEQESGKDWVRELAGLPKVGTSEGAPGAPAGSVSP